MPFLPGKNFSLSVYLRSATSPRTNCLPLSICYTQISIASQVSRRRFALPLFTIFAVFKLQIRSFFAFTGHRLTSFHEFVEPRCFPFLGFRFLPPSWRAAEFPNAPSFCFIDICIFCNFQALNSAVFRFYWPPP